MRHHDPHRHHGSRTYDVPQLSHRDVIRAGRRDGPLRVFALVDRYPPDVNAGGEWMLHGLLAPLAAAGHTVDVVTATVDPYSFGGVDVWPRPMIDDLAAQADVMIGHLMWTREAVETAARHQVPLVYIAHNHRQLRHWSLMPANVTILVVNSRWLEAAIHTPRQRGVSESDAHGCSTWNGPSIVVRPPVRVADYTLDRDPAEAPFVTMVNMTTAKGSTLFYRLADAEPRRFLAVEGGYGSQVHPGYHHPNVEWQPQTGTIRDDVYARTRVLLMPSEYESWGRTGVEAMASGIPVIAHPTPGMLEAFGDAGIFLDRARLGDWQAKLAELDDPGVYAAASQAARDRAQEMDGLALADLARWEIAIRAGAAASGVPSPA